MRNSIDYISIDSQWWWLDLDLWHENHWKSKYCLSECKKIIKVLHSSNLEPHNLRSKQIKLKLIYYSIFFKNRLKNMQIQMKIDVKALFFIISFCHRKCNWIKSEVCICLLVICSILKSIPMNVVFNWILFDMVQFDLVRTECTI